MKFTLFFLIVLGCICSVLSSIINNVESDINGNLIKDELLKPDSGTIAELHFRAQNDALVPMDFSSSEDFVKKRKLADILYLVYRLEQSESQVWWRRLLKGLKMLKLKLKIKFKNLYSKDKILRLGCRQSFNYMVTNFELLVQDTVSKVFAAFPKTSPTNSDSLNYVFQKHQVQYNVAMSSALNSLEGLTKNVGNITCQYLDQLNDFLWGKNYFALEYDKDSAAIQALESKMIPCINCCKGLDTHRPPANLVVWDMEHLAQYKGRARFPQEKVVRAADISTTYIIKPLLALVMNSIASSFIDPIEAVVNEVYESETASFKEDLVGALVLTLNQRLKRVADFFAFVMEDNFKLQMRFLYSEISGKELTEERLKFGALVDFVTNPGVAPVFQAISTELWSFQDELRKRDPFVPRILYRVKKRQPPPMLGQHSSVLTAINLVNSDNSS